MYTVYLENMGRFLDGRFDELEQAIAHGKSKGFCFSVIADDMFPIYAWGPITGGRMLAEVV